MKKLLVICIVVLSAFSFGGDSVTANLEEAGIELDFSVVNNYQQNVRGGQSTHRKRGRWAGSYDIELGIDFEKLMGIEGGSLYMLTEGSWPKSGGIDPVSVGSAFGVNGDAVPREAAFISELWYEQQLMDGQLRFRVGKMDLTGGFDHHNRPAAFDCSLYANDENSQFLNSALVNNPSIPFPERGLAAAIYYNPFETFYVGAAIADAHARERETGFHTAFSGPDDYFLIFETGFNGELQSENGELINSVSVGIWNDPQAKANSDASKEYRDDMGFYANFDQQLTRENTEDSQGLGMFARYGYANSLRNDLTNFISGGFQYQGLLEGRDDDVFGIGYAQGFFSDSASSTYTEDYESVVELYYSLVVNDSLVITPDLQYVTNTGGDESNQDAVVFGVRTLFTF